MTSTFTQSSTVDKVFSRPSAELDGSRAVDAESLSSPKHGVVYTKPWVVDLMLDLSGYTSDRDLASLYIVEPAAGDGSFVYRIVERLLDSCALYQRPIAVTSDALLAYELDPTSAEGCRDSVRQLLLDRGVSLADADNLARKWIRCGDYLLDRPQLPQADIIIGNPPYVRLEDISKGIATVYRQKYPTMVGRADLYIAFFEAALTQLRPGGVCSFICADRWMLNQYGAQLRRLITSRFGVELVLELHRADAFESEVSAYPAITIIRNQPQSQAVVARGDMSLAKQTSRELASLLSPAESSPASIRQPGLQIANTNEWFTGDQPWPCYNPDRLALLKYLEANFYPLDSEGTGTRSGIGVASGADKIYLTHDLDLVEADRLLPMAMAKDIRSGHLEWSGTYLVNPWHDGKLVDLTKHPRLAHYFTGHEPILKARHVGKRNAQSWFRTIDRVEPGLIHKPKLYIADIKERLNPVLDRGETYPHHNLYFIQSASWDHEVLGGLLLSDVAQFFIECYGVRMRGGYLRFQAQYLRRIRLPRPMDITARQAEGLKRAFQTRDRHAATIIAKQLYSISHIPEDDY